MECYTAMRVNYLQLQNNMDETHNVERKKPDTKEFIL